MYYFKNCKGLKNTWDHLQQGQTICGSHKWSGEPLVAGDQLRRDSSLKYSYCQATFSHIGKFARPIAIDYDYDKIQDKDTACKPDPYTQ